MSSTPRSSRRTLIADVVATFDFDGHAFEIFGFGDEREVDAPVYATIRGTTGGHKPVHFLYCPFLEVVFVALPEILRALETAGDAGDSKVLPFDQP